MSEVLPPALQSFILQPAHLLHIRMIATICAKLRSNYMQRTAIVDALVCVARIFAMRPNVQIDLNEDDHRRTDASEYEQCWYEE